MIVGGVSNYFFYGVLLIFLVALLTVCMYNVARYCCCPQRREEARVHPARAVVPKNVTNKDETIVEENITTDHPLLKEDKTTRRSLMNNYFIPAAENGES